MTDFVFLTITLVLFAASYGFIRLCDRLMEDAA